MIGIIEKDDRNHWKK